MSKLKHQKIDKLFKYLPKSKIKAGDGKKSGKYSFFTSSSKLSKFIDIAIYKEAGLIFGSGGSASIHYCDKPFSTSTDCFVTVKKNDEIDVKYAYYFLKSNLHILEAGFKGAGLKHISKKYISSIQIPILPLSEQQKIASFLTRIEALIQRREESIKLLDELIKSIFLEMFHFNRERERWTEKFISDLAQNKKGSMRTGPFGSNLLHSEFTASGDVAVLGIDNAVKNKFEWSKKRFITFTKYENLKRYKIYPGDIIITIMGTIGRTAVIPDDIPLSINTKHLAAITINQSISNAHFLAYSLREDPTLLSQIRKKTKGAILDGLNLTIIKSLKIAHPPKSLQDKFATIVTKIEATKAKYQASLEELNNLFNSTAQKAFKGELNLSHIEVIEKEIYKEKVQMLDEDKILELIQSGSFEVGDYVNEKQSYDFIRDMVLKLMDKGKITQKFTNDKKMILEAVN